MTEPLPTDGAYTSKVVIAGLDAIGRARAVFQPRRWDGLGAGYNPPLSPHLAYAVRGTVYFMDGYGTVFQMGLDGKQSVATRFPIPLGEQWVSFAVSPDGCQLAGSISDGFTTRTMRANFRGSAEDLHTWPGGTNVILLGWDSVGPIAVIGSSFQRPITPVNATPPLPLKYISNPDFFGGTVVHLAGDGTAGAPAAPPSCHAVQVSATGEVACYGAGDAQKWNLTVVRSTDQRELATMSLPVISACSSDPHALCMRPGVQIAMAAGGLIAATWDVVAPMNGIPTATSTGLWRGPDGAGGTLPNFFYGEGWVDSHTIFGYRRYPPEGSAFVHLNGSQPTIEYLGFWGTFVGMLTG